MRQLKELRTAAAKRDKAKAVEKEKSVIKKPAPKPVSQIKDDHQRQKQQVNRAFTAGEEIIADASEKAKKLLSEALKDQALSRGLETDLKQQLKEANELLTKTEATAQDQKENKIKLDTRQESIFVTEQAITRLSDEAIEFKQNSIDLLQDIIVLIDLTAERIANMHKRDQSRQQLSRNISESLNTVASSLQEKETQLAQKDKELNAKADVIKEQRTQLNMAKREVHVVQDLK